MSHAAAPKRSRSHLYFKQFLGLVAIAFPFILLFGRMPFDGIGMQDAISDYYYTSVKNVFVGGLVALAILLICYRYARVDNVASFLAGVCAIGVAIFPKCPTDHCLSDRQGVTGTWHYVFSVAFLLIIAFYAIFIFTEPFPPFPRLRRVLRRLLLDRLGAPAERSADHEPSRRKRQRNGIYEWCGGVILGCMLVIALHRFFGVPWPDAIHPEFLLETLAVCAFGLAWIVKGEVMLTDEDAPHPDLIQHYAGKVRALLPTRAKGTGG